MMPHGIGTIPSEAASSSRMAFASRSSCHRGDHREHDVIFPNADARSRARSCVRRISGRSSPTRMPRSPRNGLSSLGIGR